MTCNFEHDYKKLNYISEGTFSKVYTCVRKKDLKKYAVKIIPKKNLTCKDNSVLLREIKALQNLSHKSIVKLIDNYEDLEYYYLVLELCDGGSLFDLLLKLDKKKRSLKEIEVKYIIHRLTKALYYLHQHNIAHRDIKLENILLTKNGSIKLSDFGLSYYSQSPIGHRMKSSVGTPFYVAPEIIQGKYYGNEVDYWSLGVVMYLLLTGTLPFYSDNRAGLYNKILKGTYEINTDVWKNVSKEAKNLVKGLLTVDPKKRYTYKKIIQHPWFCNANTKHTTTKH